MATQYAAKVAIKNNSGGNASIVLFHSNYYSGTQSGQWQAAPGQTVGPLTALYSEWPVYDYWSVLIHVQDGPTPGFYVSGNVSNRWVEYQMQASDSGKTATFSVNATTFDIVFSSGKRSGGMTKLAPASPITHVFVVMLENHSFDNMFAMSGIKGITAATTSNSNTYNPPPPKPPITYKVQSSAPLSMSTDPGHEFQDVVEQLAGQGQTYKSGQPYPPINNSGFAANYATSDSEDTGLPTPQEVGDIMACFATPTQLKTFYHLATKYTLCDQWYCSLPGPTWPNRFFVHGASSSGLDDSPTKLEMSEWEAGGFEYPNGSIYQALTKAKIPYRFYHDSTGLPLYQSIYSDDPQNGSKIGAVPQVSSLNGVTFSDFELLSDFAKDLQGPYPYPYTFIEPHYGDVSGKYIGGSSQHPMDDVYGGEALLEAVYTAIRKSPYWNTSLLIITYDEHGGFYDCVGPGKAPAPADNPTYGYNTHGFDFTLYGVRVPAVIVSPLIPAGVNHTLFDHSSIPKTLEDLFGLKALTKRDAAAKSVKDLLLTTPRTDCPMTLDSPAPLLNAARPPMTVQERAVIDAQPLPERGNLIGALWNLRKAEIELSAGTPAELAAINARFAAIKTRGDARAYAGHGKSRNCTTAATTRTTPQALRFYWERVLGPRTSSSATQSCSLRSLRTRTSALPVFSCAISSELGKSYNRKRKREVNLMQNLECKHPEPGLERFCRRCGAPVNPSTQNDLSLKDPDELTGNGIGAVFVGDGLLIVSVILSATQTPVSSLLWLLLLIPAFFFFGKGFSDLLQARQIQRRIKQAALSDGSTESLSPASVVDVLKKTLSGELALRSVTERTTRDLN